MLYEAIVRQTYFGKNPINVFHFSSTGTPASVLGSFALMSALGFIPNGIGEFPAGSLFDIWRSFVSNDVVFREVQVSAMYDVTDFYVNPLPAGVTGAQTGESMSPVMAFGFHSSRVRTDVQSGSKRLVGAVESEVGDGGVLPSGTLTGMQQFADILNDPLTYDDEGNTLTFLSAVLSFQEYTTPAGKRAYKPYATLSAQMDHAAIGVQWSPMATIRSQVSRQYK